MKNEGVERAIESCFISQNVPDSNMEPANIVDVIANAANGLHGIARQLKHLGKGECSDERGAVEFLGIQIENGANAIADSILELADAIRTLGIK